MTEPGTIIILRGTKSNLAYAALGAVAGMRLGGAATGQAGWGQAFDAARPLSFLQGLLLFT